MLEPRDLHVQPSFKRQLERIRGTVQTLESDSRLRTALGNCARRMTLIAIM
ncbi:MAG: hypothetical protein JWM11_7691 [Planctomycetaceae bacterium]|nr:hypothetical protein [Planctomycetaceae bacterium]